jgi:hypothetical protein
MSRRSAAAVSVLATALAGTVAVLAVRGGSGADLQRAFGATPVFVTVTGPATTPAGITDLYRLELGIGRLPGVKAVYGPGTFVAGAAHATERMMTAELAASRTAATQQTAAAASVRMGFSGRPALTNWSFVSQLVFGAGVGPKPMLGWILPSADHALITVLLRAGGSATGVTRRIAALTAKGARAGLEPRVVNDGSWRQLGRQLHVPGTLHDAVQAARRTRALFTALARGSVA